MKKFVILMLLAGCHEEGCTTISTDTIDACGKTCGARGVYKVSQYSCTCQPTPSAIVPIPPREAP